MGKLVGKTRIDQPVRIASDDRCDTHLYARLKLDVGLLGSCRGTALFSDVPCDLEDACAGTKRIDQSDARQQLVQPNPEWHSGQTALIDQKGNPLTHSL